MRWSWNHATDQVWRQLDPVLWELTHNPWVVLQTVSREKLRARLGRPRFPQKCRRSGARPRRCSAGAPRGFRKPIRRAALNCVAYFSMEFMLSEALPIYSGGLGNVAGDQLKAASDLGVPVIGVGLLYQQGYFRQVIDKDGAQQALYPYNDPGQLPITPLRQAERRVAAAGNRLARLLGLAARLAGSGRPGEALSAGQQRRGELSRRIAASPASCMAADRSCA